MLGVVTEFERALDLLYNKLLVWFRQLVVMLPNLLIAALLLALTFLVARLVQRATQRLLPRFSASATLNSLTGTLAYMATLLVGVFFVLEVLNLQKTVTSLLAGVGILGLALGFAFQDIAANFISGIIIALQRPFNVGDVVESNTFFGYVERISLRTTDIRQTTGELVRVPNRKVFENPLINFTENTMRRIDLDCIVAYGSNLRQVQTVVREAVATVPHVIEGRPIEVMFSSFADRGITFEVRFWVPYRRQVDYIGARSEAILRINEAFNAHRIEIPLPRQMVYMQPADDNSPAQPGGLGTATAARGNGLA
ncbi:mechanosensitive ion channel family protein [Hymenobacter latericus]|uniref:mechanosensitive ion channel family protein n=1 Tax=Hymenobacter sp. YIM 151858-1 TaxID=2987688 RepID=UPI0022277FC3|nr:mechanosensitive ion channel family protein [Hymenobacter sp. YIM 151858-1]UYZ58358.1 mechanosensitive ion channel family protein [Hymenobacter sp. YIM 151858-1]